MVQQRTDVKQTETFEEQLSRETAQFNEGPNNPPPRRYDRESHLQRVGQVETASNIQKWLSSKFAGKPADVTQPREPERLEIGTVATAMNLT
jgi:hypothetical protein